MNTYRWIILIIAGIMLVGSVAVSLRSITKDVPVIADIESFPVIVIDPGHGGVDGGAVGIDDIIEKDINLAICLTLRDMFMINGFDVVMTRETDISIHDEGVTGTRKQKTSDLRNRLSIVNSQADALFISVHQNKFASSKSHGAQMFFSPNNPRSELLASILQERIATDIQPGNTRQIKKASKDLFLMYEAKCPSVLIECGFLSNRDDAYQLTDPDYQSKLAFTIFASVMQYLGMDEAVNPQATS